MQARCSSTGAGRVRATGLGSALPRPGGLQRSSPTHLCRVQRDPNLLVSHLCRQGRKTQGGGGGVQQSPSPAASLLLLTALRHRRPPLPTPPLPSPPLLNCPPSPHLVRLSQPGERGGGGGLRRLGLRSKAGQLGCQLVAHGRGVAAAQALQQGSGVGGGAALAAHLILAIPAEGQGGREPGRQVGAAEVEVEVAHHGAAAGAAQHNGLPSPAPCCGRAPPRRT